MCNDAVIRNNTLMGKPTEGALIALAMKVRVCPGLSSVTMNCHPRERWKTINFSFTDFEVLNNKGLIYILTSYWKPGIKFIITLFLANYRLILIMRE